MADKTSYKVTLGCPRWSRAGAGLFPYSRGGGTAPSARGRPVPYCHAAVIRCRSSYAALSPRPASGLGRGSSFCYGGPWNPLLGPKIQCYEPLTYVAPPAMARGCRHGRLGGLLTPFRGLGSWSIRSTCPFYPCLLFDGISL